ncbi:MAG: DUF302 domain-containing protein [Campylobacterales bacterium]|jgi:uncharacterized protein (DUF302 family)
MLKNILAAIGVIAIVAVIGVFAKFGGMISKVQTLDKGAMPAYMTMFEAVVENGDAARAMMNEWKINEDVENEDVVESIKALAEEYNMRITGDVKMYTKDDATDGEVKHARIFSLCSLPIAKVFLNYSRWYGGFMPCRIMLVEYGNGDRFLVAMDMTLAIHGGRPLPDDMLAMALTVKKAMEEIPARAAQGDF